MAIETGSVRLKNALQGEKKYFVGLSTGGSLATELTFVDGILTSEIPVPSSSLSPSVSPSKSPSVSPSISPSTSPS